MNFFWGVNKKILDPPLQAVPFRLFTQQSYASTKEYACIIMLKIVYHTRSYR